MASFSYFIQSNAVVFAGGAVAAGAKVYFYEGGGTTPLVVYQDAGLTTPHTWPVICSADGRIPSIYMSLSGTFNVVVKSSADVTLYSIPELSASQEGESSIQSGKRNYAETTGTSSAYVAVFDPAFIHVDVGTVVYVLPHVANDASATIDIGTGPQPIQMPSGTAIPKGVIAAGSPIQLLWTGSAFVHLPSYPRQVAAEVAYDTPGTTSATVPNAVLRAKIRCWGSGGGGAGTTSGAAGSGGGGGGYAEGIVAVVPGESLTVFVPDGGNGGSGVPTNGQNGGTASVSRGGTNLVAANGGLGGKTNGEAAGSGPLGVGALRVAGGYSGMPIIINIDRYGGIGGTAYASPTGNLPSTSTGNPGVFPGGGGGGAGSVDGVTGAAAGGKGARGLVVIEWLS